MATCLQHGTGSCDCTFVAGPNIEIVGTGPYNIYREPAAQLLVDDTPSVDLTQAGLGTDTSPRVVSGVVAIGALLAFDPAGLDVVVAGAGTALSPMVVSAWLSCLTCNDPARANGKVLMMRSDGDYHPTVVPTIPAGALSVGVGLAGDGSAGNPLHVDLCTYDDLAAVCGTP